MTIDVERTGSHEFVGRNGRGAEVRIGRVGQEGSFSPVELLLAAAAGCVAITGEELILRRTGEIPIRAAAADVRPAGAHQLDGVDVSLDLDLSGLDAEAQAEVRAIVTRAVEALCTVTRTLKQSNEVRLTIA
ncbi:OsmC family protein [Actinokineospora xionganensis]|uniref:OsmC family protein n=1 Tax=Actinokineospora xionganensis TaxID=2684470 RepID=A0ABR7LA47_9PSEU|nr:OsmC family protein [Actinokineospora xionganensis]MBC6449581.1 OsmC family protein [Actinokineospora xionganensis]